MDLLALHAASHPDKLAVIDDRPGRTVTTWRYAEFNQRANQLAHHLVGLGVDKAAKVVSCGPNSDKLLLGSHAVRKAGAVEVPLNYRLSPDEAAYVIDNSDAGAVYVDAEFAGLVWRIRDRIPKVRDVLVFDGDGELERLVEQCPTSPLESADGATTAPATMIYTSGTTGKPKGAIRQHAPDPSAIAGLITLIGYSPDDVYLTTGPLYHSGPGGSAALAQALGGTVVVQRKFDPEDWLRLVHTYQVTTTFTAPTPMRLVCSLPASVKARYDRSSMRRLIANAAPWTLALKKMYLADFPPDSLWEIYGSTELGVDTVLRPEDQLRKPGSCGQPVPGVEIKLFDDDGLEVSEPLRTGELYVRSASMFDTYYKAEQKYNEATRGDFHSVGDIAYRDEEGYYYIADRKNDMIISGGMNVYPAEVEAALDASPDIFEVAVVGLPSEEWGETVHAVVVPARAGVTEADIQTFARDHIAAYKVPRSVSFVPELPKTGSGKVLKRELRASLQAP